MKIIKNKKIPRNKIAVIITNYKWKQITIKMEKINFKNNGVSITSRYQSCKNLCSLYKTTCPSILYKGIDIYIYIRKCSLYKGIDHTYINLHKTYVTKKNHYIMGILQYYEIIDIN